MNCAYYDLMTNLWCDDWISLRHVHAETYLIKMDLWSTYTYDSLFAVNLLLVFFLFYKFDKSLRVCTIIIQFLSLSQIKRIVVNFSTKVSYS